ncbi:Protein CBG27815 [Caenorhabditis briggsae]|uniref:Protein CBG27815 n=1 Tax=Caenorhabditis briggsae TaxID=6238 RepID=B6IK97_CAEBR|nr:Protein CBG27815 [Caenorhabditis briggsae]CAS00327.1 Protein CBG27815 [Caenorhabditis briggsae]
MEPQPIPIPPAAFVLNENTESSMISQWKELDTSYSDIPMPAAPHLMTVDHASNHRLGLCDVALRGPRNVVMPNSAELIGSAPRPVQNSPMLSQRAQERVVLQNSKGVNHVDLSNVTEPARHPGHSHGMVTPDQKMQRIDGYHNPNNINQNQEYKHSIYVPLHPTPTMLGLPTAFAPKSYNGIAEILEKAENPTPAVSRQMTEHNNTQLTPQDHMIQRNYEYQDSFYFFPPQTNNYPMHAQLYPSPPIFENPLTTTLSTGADNFILECLPASLNTVSKLHLRHQWRCSLVFHSGAQTSCTISHISPAGTSIRTIFSTCLFLSFSPTPFVTECNLGWRTRSNDAINY